SWSASWQMRRASARAIIGYAPPHVAEARRGGAVPGPHRLPGLALAAGRNPPQDPVGGIADGVASVPELDRDALIRRVPQHPSPLAVPDLPADLGAELEVVPVLVDAPAAVHLHEDAVVGVGDQVVELPGAGHERHVHHADE